MSVLTVVLIVLATLSGLVAARLLFVILARWSAARLERCSMCYRRPAVYWFDEGREDAFACCPRCIDQKIGLAQRLRWVDSGRLTPYVPKPRGAQ